MKESLRACSAILLLALLSVGAVAAGCGGSSDETYGEMLNGLAQAAAHSDTSFAAVERSESLTAADGNVLRAFCLFAQKIVINHEAWKLPQHAYVVSRIRRDAYNMGGAYSIAIRSALAKLNTVIDLSTVTNSQLKAYHRACGGAEAP